MGILSKKDSWKASNRETVQYLIRGTTCRLLKKTAEEREGGTNPLFINCKEAVTTLGKQR